MDSYKAEVVLLLLCFCIFCFSLWSLCKTQCTAVECYALREWIAPELIIETGSSEFGKTGGRLDVDNNQLKPIAGDSFAKIEGKLYIFFSLFKTTKHLAPEQCLWYCPRGMSLSGTKFQRRFKSRFRPGRTIRRINSKPSQQKVWDRQTKARPFKKQPPPKKRMKKNNFCLWWRVPARHSCPQWPINCDYRCPSPSPFCFTKSGTTLETF